MKDRSAGSFVIVRNCAFEYLLGATYFSFSSRRYLHPVARDGVESRRGRDSLVSQKVAHALSILLSFLFLFLSLPSWFPPPWSQRVDCRRVAGGLLQRV